MRPPADFLHLQLRLWLRVEPQLGGVSNMRSRDGLKGSRGDEGDG
jgi:hypothetical protein